MWALIISISCSVAVSVLLKLARHKHIDVAQAIAFNYLTAITLTVLLLSPKPLEVITHGSTSSYALIIALGVLLPSVFIIMAKAVQHAGIVLSDAAQRLSLVIPLIAAATLFGEAIQGNKLIGITLGFLALGCLSLGSKENTNKSNNQGVMWLVGVWLGYGVIDILFKQLAKSGAGFSSYLLITFALAGVLLFIKLFRDGVVWQRRHALAGVLLGVLNFSNIYFYIRAHQLFPDNPTLVFTAMNIGVITLGTLTGAVFFKERLHAFSVAGLFFALGAIWMLIP